MHTEAPTINAGAEPWASVQTDYAEQGKYPDSFHTPTEGPILEGNINTYPT